MGGDKLTWAKDINVAGLKVFEEWSLKNKGKYSYGDSVTMADICIMPQLYNAIRFGIDL